MTKTWFETVKLPQLFIEPRFRVEVDERVEGGVEIKVNVQNEMVNLHQCWDLNRDIHVLNQTSAICS